MPLGLCRFLCGVYYSIFTERVSILLLRLSLSAPWYWERMDLFPPMTSEHIEFREIDPSLVHSFGVSRGCHSARSPSRWFWASSWLSAYFSGGVASLCFPLLRGLPDIESLALIFDATYRGDSLLDPSGRRAGTSSCTFLACGPHLICPLRLLDGTVHAVLLHHSILRLPRIFH